MHKIEIFQIDAFTDKMFHGNPAAICLLDNWLNDELLHAIAIENNLSETAFVIEGKTGYEIRWFAPSGEINLCGHATLAAGFLLFELRKNTNDQLCFSSLSGPLTVRKKGALLTMEFPRFQLNAVNPKTLQDLIDQPVVLSYESDLDYLILLENDAAVSNATVHLTLLANLPKRGLILTAASGDADFYSRCFYPKHKIPEDPVTGSAHCILAPFWAERLNKSKLRAVQGSFRKGEILCEVMPERVDLSGHCKWYLKGHLLI